MPCDHSGLPLGLLRHVPEEVAAAPALRSYRTPVPVDALGRQAVAFAPRAFGNLTLPDCTGAGLANAALGFGALNGFEPAIVDAKIPLFYAGCVGCAPTEAAIAATDGAVMLDVLKRQLRFGVDVGGQTPMVADFAVIDPQDRAQLADVVARLGVGYLGVQLAVADQTMDIWDTASPASAGDPMAGSWGGHCLDIWDFDGVGDTDMVTLVTWGTFKRATWRWLRARIAEAYALLFRDLMPASGRAWDGIDLAGLRAEVAEWSAA